MARSEPELIISQSLLDRLTDEDPTASADAPVTRAQSFRAFKAALRRDLEWLLNTRQTPLPAEDHLRELARSLYNYGVPDLVSLSGQSSRDRNLLRDCLQEAIELFEPRLAEVRVFSEPGASSVRMLRFRIEGVARIDPAPEHVTFDTVLELTSGEYEVR